MEGERGISMRAGGIVAGFGAVLGCLAFVLSGAAGSAEAAAPDGTATKLVFVGDVMLDRGVQESVLTAGNADWSFPFAQVRSVVRDADLAFANLESIISDRGERMKPSFLCCSFRAPPPALSGLQDAGFDVVSVANNHAGDFGRDAMADSAGRLRSGGILPVGFGENDTDARKPVLLTVGDTTFAYLAYTDRGSSQWRARDGRSGFAFFARAGRSGIAWLREETLAADVAAARTIADVVIVSMHTGTEYQSSPSPKTQRLARRAIDEGATIVVAHHPHVAQPVERYGEGVIAYSLGNFVFDQDEGENPGVRDGLLLEVSFEGRVLTGVSERPIRINDDHQPQLTP